MWIPSHYPEALTMLLISMLCWGSWANALKLMRTCRFELFYWDYVFGTTLISIVLAFTIGSAGKSGSPFLVNLFEASSASILFAFAGGVVFNVSNIFLTAAIELAGLAVAFPVGVGLSIVIGVILNYIIVPKNDPVLLFGGVFLLLLAIVLDAHAYRVHLGSSSQKTSRTGIWLCVVSGLGLGLFYPLVAKSISEPRHLGPYGIGVIFMLGMLASNFVVNAAIMRYPVTGQPALRFSDYWRMPRYWHILGLLLGGAVWGIGSVLNFVVSSTLLVGPATSFALGDGATMVSALWGLFLWKEFRGASSRVNMLLALMILLFIAGLSCIAVSPIISLV
jgi:glucose uptake protein